MKTECPKMSFSPFQTNLRSFLRTSLPFYFHPPGAFKTSFLHHLLPHFHTCSLVCFTITWSSTPTPSPASHSLFSYTCQPGPLTLLVIFLSCFLSFCHHPSVAWTWNCLPAHFLITVCWTLNHWTVQSVFSPPCCFIQRQRHRPSIKLVLHNQIKLFSFCVMDSLFGNKPWMALKS